MMKLTDLTAGTRTLFAHKPGVIDLGIGAPDDTLLSVVRAAIHRAAPAHLSEPEHALFCQYGPRAGDPVFRQALASFVGRQLPGSPPEVAQLFVTAGATSGLHLIASTFFPQGAPALIEDPTYFLARTVLVQAGMKLLPIAQDEGGIDLQRLEDCARALPQPSGRHRFRGMVYLVPTFNNPTGRTLSAGRRQAIVDIAQKHNLLVVCDDVYDMLSFAEPPPARMVTHPGSAGVVLSNASFSKILGPGLRCGWIEGDATLLHTLSTSALVRSGGGMSHFTSGFLLALLSSGEQDRVLCQLRQTYAERCAVLCDALREHLPAGISFHQPQGGYFVWLTCPSSIHTLEALESCQQCAGVRYQPGTWFGSTPSALRLSFAHNHSDHLRQGAHRLGAFLSSLL